MPLRGTDRLEDAVAWLLGCLGLLTLLVAVLVGFDTYGGVAERAAGEAADRTRVRVVLLDETPDAPDAPVSRLGATRQVSTRWAGPDGREHVGRLAVSGPVAAGTEIPAWVDRSGELTRPPTSAASAVLAGLLSASGIAVAGWSVLRAAWIGVCRLTAGRNLAGWAQEWARVAPGWTGRTGRTGRTG